MKNKILICFVLSLLVMFIISGCYQREEIIDIEKPKKSDKTSKKVDYSNNNLSLVWNDRYSFVDKQITVVASTDYVQGLVCTQLACPPEECCNSCGSAIGLRISDNDVLEVRGPEENGFYDGKRVGCYGNNCEVSCYPLEIRNKYLVTGILRKETIAPLNIDLFHLELKSFKLI